MYVLGERSKDGKRAGPTIYELNAQGQGRSRREVPRLVAAGVGICWRAGRRELITIAALEVLPGVGGAAGFTVGGQWLGATRVTKRAGGGAGAGVAGGTGAAASAGF